VTVLITRNVRTIYVLVSVTKRLRVHR